jgi:hypothetical protein
MFPIGQKGAQRRHERERLVQQHMVLGLGNFDHGCGAAQEVEHVFPDLGRQQDRILAPEDRDSAFGGF